MLLEVLAQPFDLFRIPGCKDRAVQRNDVPTAERVAVIAAAVGPGVRPEVIEIGPGVLSPVIVIAWSGPCPRLVTTPARFVAVVELRRRARRIRVIADGEHGTRYPIEQVPGRRRAGAAIDRAVRNISSADEHHRFVW